MAQQVGSTTPALYPVVFVDVQVVADDGLKIPDLGPGSSRCRSTAAAGASCRRKGSRSFRRSRPPTAQMPSLDSSTQYRLGIEPEASDHDGNAHQLIVTVDADGRTVHASRRQRMCGCRHGPPPRRRLPPRRSGRARRRRRSRTSRRGNVFGAALKRSPRQRTQPGSTARRRLRRRRPPSFPPSDLRRPLANTHGLRRSLRDGTHRATRACSCASYARMSDFERVRPDLVSTLARWRN